VFLIDTNVWLELLLEQENSNQVRAFLQRIDADQLAISDFSIYSIGIILTRLNKTKSFKTFYLTRSKILESKSSALTLSA
jgi:PIN domain nuclease of toxin-antitoxin system